MNQSASASRAHAGHTGDTRITPGDILSPVNLPLWLGLGMLRLLSTLPYDTQMRIGRYLGRFAYHVLRGRRRIAATNLELCFPEVDKATRARMLHEHFDALGMSILETGMTWWRPQSWFAARCRIEGREHVDQALAKGAGILMLTPHYTALDIAGLGATHEIPMHANFAPPRNPLFSKLLQRGRRRHLESLIDHNDLRGIVRTLRRNEIMFFAPDQTVRRKRAGVLVPFFGIPVLTSTGTSRLAQISKAPVLTMLLLRNRDHSGYTIRFLPPLEHFPTTDVEADTARVNAHIEACIRANEPAQYLWVHQRFKRGEKDAFDSPYANQHQLQQPKLPPATYQRMSLLLAPVMAGYTLRRAWRDGGRTYLAQRYGHDYPETAPGSTWLHAASVGEVITAMPLVRALADAGHGPLVLSTGTPTGMRVARQRAPEGTTLVYLPIDRPGPVGRFLHHFRPGVALILETELWPWLFSGLHNRGIPPIIINGRLSHRTREARGWLREAARFCARRARAILARSDDDAAAFRQLGASGKRVQTVGNLKFAAVADNVPVAIDPGRPYLLAASTHADEEQQLARAWLAHPVPGHLLVIAPRHPERGPRLARELAATGATVGRRGAGESINADTDIHLADTLGELPQLIAGAQAVFMGGSLISHGGQNVLEPARIGRAILTGPHTANFRDETDRLERAGALLRVADADEAIARFHALIADDSERSTMARKAQELVMKEADVADRYVQEIRALLAEY